MDFIQIFKIFPLAEEKELAELVELYADRGFPFRPKKLCMLAYELASKNGQPGFSPTKKRAGRYWLKGFLKRYPKIVTKTANNLSINRAMAGNRYQLDKFYVQYKTWLDRWHINYQPNAIWNVDECGLPDVPKEGRVLASVGQRAFQTVSGEKPTNSTLLCFVSAGGLATPPLLIMKGTKVMPEWREATPTGYMVRTSSSGYINQDLFTQYGTRFVQYLRDNHLLFSDASNKKNLLLLDMHKSHLFNIKFMRMMKANNIEVGSFPPHCTHLIQPLDDVPFAALKNMYNDALLQLNFRLAGKKMTKPQFFRLLVPAFTAAMSPEAIRKGFSNTGIFPFNPNALKVWRIGPSLAFDRCKSLKAIEVEV